MTLVTILIILLAGGLVAGVTGRFHAASARVLSLLAIGAALVVALAAWWRVVPAGAALGERWLLELSAPWLPRFGIRFHVGVDGLSFALLILTLVLGILAVAASWREFHDRAGFFHLSLLWTLAGVVGVFIALDLFLFYFFWELMLVPMYFLIGVFGHEGRARAAVKFFIFTQASGLFMLVAIIALAIGNARTQGELSFDYDTLLRAAAGRPHEMLLMLGFFVAFAVKLPAVPLHTWLPDAHTEAPTAGSLLLAGLLLKTGGYGLLRFAIPLFPHAAREFAPVAMALGVLGIIYGAVLAFAQNDLKRLVAYTSVSHLGFVLLAVYAHTPMARDGAILEMLCHGLSTGGLFVLVGALEQRTHTRDLRRLGGLWQVIPRFGSFALLLALASLGLPGLGNFVAELLIIIGVFASNAWAAILAAFGLVLAMVYALTFLHRGFFGPLLLRLRPAPGRPEPDPDVTYALPDLSAREVLVLGSMVVLLFWLGLYPQPVLTSFSHPMPVRGIMQAEVAP